MEGGPRGEACGREGDGVTSVLRVGPSPGGMAGLLPEAGAEKAEKVGLREDEDEP